MKLFALENGLLKHSYDSWFIKLTPEIRELWLNKSDLAAVLTHGCLQAINANGFITPREQNAHPHDSKDVFTYVKVGI